RPPRAPLSPSTPLFRSALPIALLRPWRRAIAASAAVLGCLAVAALPWLVPALASAATTDPAAVDVFAVRADTPLGTVASLLSLRSEEHTSELQSRENLV